MISPISPTNHFAISPIPPINHSATSPISPSESASHSGEKSLVSRPTFNRLTIPTKNASLASGFPYDPRVYDLISHDEWHLLSQDIVRAAKISFSEDYAAWTTGVTTGVLTTPLILVGPVAGYYAGRAVHRKTVVRTVKERLDRDGELRAVLRRWNETKFQDRGFEAWLELPVDGAEIKLHSSLADESTHSKKERKIAKQISKRFKIVIVPNSGVRGQETTCKSPSANRELPLAEVMGNELKDPVELQNTSPAEPPALEMEESTLEIEPVATPKIKQKSPATKSWKSRKSTKWHDGQSLAELP